MSASLTSLLFKSNESDRLTLIFKMNKFDKKETINHGGSFVKSDGSKSLRSLFTKGRMSN